MMKQAQGVVASFLLWTVYPMNIKALGIMFNTGVESVGYFTFEKIFFSLILIFNCQK